MSKTIEGVYENGVLRPLEPLPLAEHQQVRITVDEVSPKEEPLDIELLQQLDAMEIPAVSLEEVQKRLSKIRGSLTADFIAEREERF